VNEAMEVEPLPFNTAGGRQVSKHMIPMRAEGFGRQSAAVANAYLMEKTPPVLSVGKRVHWHGCSFVWMNGFLPCMITEESRVLLFEVQNDIPYMTKTSAKWSEDQQKAIRRAGLENFDLAGVRNNAVAGRRV